MKSVTIHGAFLGLMLILAYQAWTPNETNPATLNSDGDYTVWELRPGQLERFTFTRSGRTTTVERREDNGETYLWGTTVEPPRPLPTDDSLSDSTNVVMTEPQPTEFPIGDEGEGIWDRLVHLPHPTPARAASGDVRLH